MLATTNSRLATIVAYVFIGSIGIFFTRDKICYLSMSNYSSIRVMLPTSYRLATLLSSLWRSSNEWSTCGAIVISL